MRLLAQREQYAYRVLGLDWHSPGTKWDPPGNKPYQLKDFIPSDYDFDPKEWMGEGMEEGEEWNPQQPTGKWYHTSPYQLKPGDRLRPSRDLPEGYTPGGADWYGGNNWNRRNYVWMSPSLEDAKWWQNWAGHGSRVYEVHPGDRPQRWNYNGGPGWVAPHATIKRELTPEELK